MLAMEIENIEREEQEYSHAMVDNEYDHLNSTQVDDSGLNQSLNRSGLTRSTKQTSDASVQTDPVCIEKSKL